MAALRPFVRQHDDGIADLHFGMADLPAMFEAEALLRTERTRVEIESLRGVLHCKVGRDCVKPLGNGLGHMLLLIPRPAAFYCRSRSRSKPACRGLAPSSRRR